MSTYGLLPFIAGATLADLVCSTCAVSGLAAFADNAYKASLVVKPAGMAYLA